MRRKVSGQKAEKRQGRQRTTRGVVLEGVG